MTSKVNDIQSKDLAYHLSNYDICYIILKAIAPTENFKEFIHYDTKRKVHYLKGKLAYHEKLNFSKQVIHSYPNADFISVIPLENLETYKNERHNKEDYLVQVHYSSINNITVMMDDLDWK